MSEGTEIKNLFYITQYSGLKEYDLLILCDSKDTKKLFVKWK